MYKSNFDILGTMIYLETPFIEINNFICFLLRRFKCDYLKHNPTKIIVKSNSKNHNTFKVFKNNKLLCEYNKVQYERITKVLENILTGHALNAIDKQKLITFHSSSVSINKKGILILGDSGYGKSTLSLEMVANHNYDFLSEEVGLIDKNIYLLPFYRTISCIPGIIQVNEKWQFMHFFNDYQIAVPKEKYGEPSPLRVVFFVKYSSDSKTTINPISKSESLVRLLNAQIGRAKYVATVEQVAEVVKRVNSYQIFHNDATQAAKLVTKLMENE